MKATGNANIDKFIIEETLISPIQKLVDELLTKPNNDKRIKVYHEKLNLFCGIAAKTFGVKLMVINTEPSFEIMNPVVCEYYLTRFQKLLNYFKTF